MVIFSRPFECLVDLFGLCTPEAFEVVLIDFRSVNRIVIGTLYSGGGACFDFLALLDLGGFTPASAAA